MYGIREPSARRFPIQGGLSLVLDFWVAECAMGPEH